MNQSESRTSSTAGATAGTHRIATATEVPLLGQTGAPLPVSAREQLPLGPLPGSRYPDAHIETIDAKRFKGSPGTGAVERVATGFRWAEGPAYLRAGRYLIFSDIPNNRQMRLLEDDNHLSVFRSPSYNSNGNTVDRQGRLITCQHGGRRVVRTEFDGRVTVIADSYNGKKLNAPNDVVVASDDSIWFSDPMYGISGNYEGLQAEQEQPTRNVYRVDSRSGEVKVVADDFTQPNGLAFSPDERKLYIVDSGITHGGETHIRSSMSMSRRVGSPAARSSSMIFRSPVSLTVFDWISRATSGQVWVGPIRRRMACAAMRPTAT
jgi:gluconolactonase